MFKRSILAIACCLSSFALADNSRIDFINAEVKKFYSNSMEYYFTPITKTKIETIQKIGPKDRSKVRQSIVRSSAYSSRFGNTKSEPLSNDLVDDLFRGHRIERNIKTLEAKGLGEGELDVQPWSDDYWPIYKGNLGARYTDEEFKEISNWKEAHDYVKERPALKIFHSGEDNKINLLSPSEKFDLLLSGKKQVLTKNMWDQGRYYYERSDDGHIENWMGICHGWAAASYMVPRPAKSIEVMAFDNKTKIEFFPSDLKSLASLLWSSTRFSTNFLGGRCSRKDPETNDDDRPYAENCLDNNPATFHLALVNGIGILGKSFVMDITYDYEVWNQPVVAYNAKYFNPMTKEGVDDVSDGIIALKNFKDDPY